MLRLAILTPIRFCIALAFVLGVVFTLLQFPACAPSSPVKNLEQDGRLHVFFLPDCPHCHEAIEFLKTQPKIDFVLHDVSTRTNRRLLSMVANQHGIPAEDLGVPLFVLASHYLIGFESTETTGRELLALVAEKTNDATSRKGGSK